MKGFKAFIFLLLFLFSAQVHAALTTIYNPSAIRFKHNGQEYQISPKRMFQAECDERNCHFTVSGGIPVSIPRNSSSIMVLGASTAGSSRRMTMAKTEAASPAPCADCNSRSAGLKSLPTNTSASSQAGFMLPVSGKFSSEFGMRVHPITKVRKMHSGIDISRNNGRTIVASNSGVITSSGNSCRNGRRKCNGGRGNYVTISHGNGIETRYYHLNPQCRIPKPGTRVAKGQAIGCVGSTGMSTGPHLHFEFIINGRAVNPLNYVSFRRSS